jgi:hypothetical protein
MHMYMYIDIDILILNAGLTSIPSVPELKKINNDAVTGLAPD